MFGYYTAIIIISVYTLATVTYGVLADTISVGRRYAYVFVSIIATAICEWAGVALDGMKEWAWLLMAAKFLEFSIAPFIPLILAELMTSKDRRRYYMPLLTIHCILEFISMYTGFIFEVDKAGHYYHGRFYNIYVFSYVLSYAYLVFCIAIYCRNNKYRNQVYLTLDIVFLALGVIVQSVTDLRIDWLCAAIGSLLMYLHFITQEQKQSLDKLEVAVDEANRANASKTSFLSRMSHDLRTPINGISGMLHIAQKNINDPEVVADCLKKIDQASTHLLSLINDVLDVSKLESGKIELEHVPFNLEEVLNQCLTIMEQPAAEKSVTVFEDSKSHIECPNLIGSPLHVRQIFLNLLSNGVKYNKVGGTIEVNCQLISHREDKVIYRFFFIDTGIGMSEEFQKHIFDPFSRETDVVKDSYQGTGLGMSIVKDLVDKMEGTIKVLSEKNIGTTFILDIPFDVDTTPRSEASSDEPSRNFNGKHILVVEDNSLNLEIACYLLQEEGFVTDTARNGKEALFKFENSPVGFYSYVLMDVMMPMMNGLEATKAIRALSRKDAGTIPIIAMTANAFEEDKKETFAAGMNDHLSKPLDAELVMSTLAKYNS